MQECLLDLREHDVPYHVRFAIDTGVRAGHWFEVRAEDGRIGLKHRCGAGEGGGLCVRVRVCVCGEGLMDVCAHARAPTRTRKRTQTHTNTHTQTHTHTHTHNTHQGGPQEARRAGGVRLRH